MHVSEREEQSYLSLSLGTAYPYRLSLHHFEDRVEDLLFRNESSWESYGTIVAYFTTVQYCESTCILPFVISESLVFRRQTKFWHRFVYFMLEIVSIYNDTVAKSPCVSVILPKHGSTLDGALPLGHRFPSQK